MSASNAAPITHISHGVVGPPRAGVRRMLCGEACFVMEDGASFPAIAFVGVRDGWSATCLRCRQALAEGRIEVPPSPGIKIPPVG